MPQVNFRGHYEKGVCIMNLMNLVTYINYAKTPYYSAYLDYEGLRNIKIRVLVNGILTFQIPL